MKVLVKLLRIPVASVHLMVIVWVPFSRLVGGLKRQVPCAFTLTVLVIGSDSMVIVSWVFGGPSPKNSGFEVKITSPDSFMLSRVTVEVVVAGSPDISRPPGPAGP